MIIRENLKRSSTKYKVYNLIKYYKLQTVVIPFRLQLNLSTLIELQTDINEFTEDAEYNY